MFNLNVTTFNRFHLLISDCVRPGDAPRNLAVGLFNPLNLFLRPFPSVGGGTVAVRNRIVGDGGLLEFKICLYSAQLVNPEWD